jgi:Protein of unknown function (DUF3175)
MRHARQPPIDADRNTPMPAGVVECEGMVSRMPGRGRVNLNWHGVMAGKSRKRWSAEVTKHSNALDLEEGVFTLTDPKQIAASLKRSAEASRRKKADSYRSALSMLTFYINRAGTNLPAQQHRVLMRAKDELRKQFGRE